MTDSSNRKLPFCGFQTGQLFSFFNKLPYASPYSLIQLKRGGGAHAADMTTGQKGGLGEAAHPVLRYFAMIASSNSAGPSNGDRSMGSVESLRSKAEEYLEKARAINNRQRARLLLVHAHNYLKCAEETEAQQLSAGRADRDTLRAGGL
jgi:hypothetical protein